MAIYMSDRERRINGDRIVAKAASFEGIHPAVKEVFGGFAAAHAALAERVDARLAEEHEDLQARGERERAAEEGARLYAWAWHAVPGLLRPSWSDGAPDEGALDELRERLFPLGPVSELRGAQLVIDALTHLASGMGRVAEISFPDDFRGAVAAALERLKAATAEVAREGEETAAENDANFAARADWDRHWLALREVTAGFLRLAGALERRRELFDTLPARRASATEGEAPVDDAEASTPDGGSAAEVAA